MNDVRWVKASRSGKQGNCLEITDDLEPMGMIWNGKVFTLALRESEFPNDFILTTRENFTAFVAAAKAGEFDYFLVPERDDVERHAKLASLSARERQVLNLLANGMNVTAIAKEWWVSVSTVRTQVRSIFTKLGVNSQIAAVAYVRMTSDKVA